MRKIKELVKQYIKESLDSLLIDQIASACFGALAAWLFGKNVPMLDDPNTPTYIKFLLLGIAFFVVYIIEAKYPVITCFLSQSVGIMQK